MIFILDLILFLNIWVAYRLFRNIVAPPVLMGIGMFLASLIATSYYEEWSMEQMLPESVLILGGGTCFFTMCCIVLNRISPNIQTESGQKIDMAVIRIKRLKLFYLGAILLGALVLLAKIYYMRAEFGSLNLAELIMARRIDHWGGDNELKIPAIIRMAGSFSMILCYFTVWCLSIKIITKYKDRLLSFLLIGQLTIVIIDGMLTGSKGSMIALPISFLIVYAFFYYSQKERLGLKKSFFIKLICTFVILSSFFKSLSLMIGREVEDIGDMDLFAIYCGAEIKNFDIYLHQSKIFSPASKWGYYTFNALYSELNLNDNKGPGEFQRIGGMSLGNVYTQFRPYHEDFGTTGVFVMMIVIAIITMFFYNKSFSYMQKPTVLNIYLIVYSTMAMSIFMAFFSSKITENVFRLGYFRQVIYICVLVWFTKKYLLHKISKNIVK